MTMIPLPVSALRPHCPIEWIATSPTNVLLPPFQERAARVLSTGIAMRRAPFHVLLAGSEGLPALALVHAVAGSAGVLQARSPGVEQLQGHFETDPATSSLRFVPGLLAQARGGVLVIDARSLLADPALTETLNRCLVQQAIDWRPMASEPWLGPRPAPEALDLTLVIRGERGELDALTATHDALREAFGLLADLQEDIPLEPAAITGFTAWLQARAINAGLPPIAPATWAVLVEHAARLAEERDHVSLACEPLMTLLAEACVTVSAGMPLEPGQLWDTLSDRALRWHQHDDRLLRHIRQGALNMPLSGRLIGTVTGITLIELHGHSLMLPVKITATVRQGEGKIVDIERETDLGGPSHSKGVLILSAWLGAAFQPAKPFSILAHLACEQSHDHIDGDSASVAELAGLISALGQIPMHQGIALTGAVSQHGDVFAVGGINDKIEGHFRLCRALGGDGPHGVVIPAGNVGQLCLAPEVVAAVAEGRFAIHAVSHVSEAMALLSDLPWEAGDAVGDSVRQRVSARLEQFERSMRDDTARHHWPRQQRDR